MAIGFWELALDEARELHRLGVASADVGQLTQARQHFEQALDLLALDEVAPGPDVTAGTVGTVPGKAEIGGQVETGGQAALGARILLSLAFTVASLDTVTQGLDLLDRADRLIQGEPVQGLDALIACNRGLLLADAGQPLAGLRHLDRAVELAGTAELEQQVKIIMNRGYAHLLLSHIDDAERDFAAALELAEAHDLADFQFQATHNLGFVAYLNGDLPRALSLIPNVADGLTSYDQGVVGSGRAEVLLAAGLVDEADRVLQEACEALAATDYDQLLAEAELNRAEAALMTKDYRRAEELSRTAGRRFRASGNDRLLALAELVRLRAELKRGLDPRQGAARARDLARELAEHALPDQSRLAQLLAAEAALDAGDVTEAVTVRTRNGEPINLRLHVRLVHAREAYARGAAARGRREVRRGLAELAAYQARFGSFDLQTSSAAHGVDLAALAVAEDVAAGRPAQVLGWLEAVRAIGGHVPQVKPPDDPAAASLLTELRWVGNQLEAEDTEAEALPELRRRRQQVERAIRSLSWTRPGAEGTVRTPGVGEIRAAAGHATVVAIFWLNEDVHGLVITADRVRLQRLGRLSEAENLGRRVNADLDVLALSHVPVALRESARHSVRRGLSALDALLLAPLRLPDSPVVLLPPGRLAALPWGGLSSMRSRPLTVAPSAASWLDASARRSPGGRRVVAIAGPGLQRAESEVASVARAWPGCLSLVGGAATRAAVLAAVDGADLVHVAAHGRHQPMSPLFSSIRLADGPVVGYDWDRVAEAPRQVVLSACDLGQATVRPGDEALGLTRALLHSGTSTVISGVTKVSDEAAAELMADYHARLARGAAPAYALSEALAQTTDPQPFVCFGAGW